MGEEMQFGYLLFSSEEEISKWGPDGTSVKAAPRAYIHTRAVEGVFYPQSTH